MDFEEFYIWEGKLALELFINMNSDAPLPLDNMRDNKKKNIILYERRVF